MSEPGACIVVGTTEQGNPTILAAGTDEAVAAGFDAVALIREAGPHIKGGGGGKASMAQAGGKNADGISDAVSAMREMLKS